MTAIMIYRPDPKRMTAPARYLRAGAVATLGYALRG